MTFKTKNLPSELFTSIVLTLADTLPLSCRLQRPANIDYCNVSCSRSIAGNYYECHVCHCIGAFILSDHLDLAIKLLQDGFDRKSEDSDVVQGEY